MELYFEQWHIKYQWCDILVGRTVKRSWNLIQRLTTTGQGFLLDGKGCVLGR